MWLLKVAGLGVAAFAAFYHGFLVLGIGLAIAAIGSAFDFNL